MNRKKLFSILCIVLLFWSVPVFADDQKQWQYSAPQQYVTKEIEVRNGKLIFASRCEQHEMGCRCLPTLDISIKEKKAGLLQDGDVIYFETSKYDDKYFQSWLMQSETKGVSIEELSFPDKKENHFAIRITRENNQKLAEINMRFQGDLNVSYKEEHMPTFALYLDVSEKENNLFSGEQNILLNEQFLILTGGEAERKQRENEIQQKLKNGLPEMLFCPEYNIMWCGDKKRELKHAVYVNQNGAAMLSLEDFSDILNSFDDIGTKMVKKSYDDGTDYYHISAGIYDYFIYPGETTIECLEYEQKNMENVLEQKDDTIYIPLRAVAKILDMENHIVYNTITRMITISRKFTFKSNA